MNVYEEEAQQRLCEQNLCRIKGDVHVLLILSKALLQGFIKPGLLLDYASPFL